MNDDKILRSIKELVEVIKQKVDRFDSRETVTTFQLTTLKEQQSVINEKLDDLGDSSKEQEKRLKKIEEILENQVLPSVAYIEQNVKSYADMYKRNDDNVRKIQKRLGTLEEKSGVIPPEELTLVDVS